jgi:hypothetical protein
MPDRDQRKLTLVVDGAAEPIAGTLRDERGTRHAFAGWVGLAATLERFLGTRSGTPSAGSEPATRQEEVK